MSEQKQNYWQDAYDGIQEMAFGIYGSMESVLGYFVFASGYTGAARYEKCFFPPASYGNQEARDAALSQAQAFSKANGDARIDWCNALRLYRESCVRGDGTSVSDPSASGQGKGWDSDQFDVVTLWPLKAQPDKPSAAKARLDAFDKFDIRPGVRFYGKVSKTNDPYKVSIGQMDDTDLQGKPRYKQFYNVVEAYTTEEAMLGAIGVEIQPSTVSVAGDTDTPAGWEAGAWKSVLPEIWAAKEAGSTNVELAKLYNVDVPTLAKSLAAFIPM